MCKQSLQRRDLQSSLLDSDRHSRSLGRRILLRLYASMLSNIDELDTLRCHGWGLHQHQCIDSRPGVFRRLHRHYNPFAATTLHLGYANADQAQARYLRYLPDWSADRWSWDCKACRFSLDHWADQRKQPRHHFHRHATYLLANDRIISRYNRCMSTSNAAALCREAERSSCGTEIAARRCSNSWRRWGGVEVWSGIIEWFAQGFKGCVSEVWIGGDFASLSGWEYVSRVNFYVREGIGLTLTILQTCIPRQQESSKIADGDCEKVRRDL